jgi:hypothetical protein
VAFGCFLLAEINDASHRSPRRKPVFGRATMDSKKRLEAKRQFSAVAQVVGFGSKRSKMPYLSMGVD